MIVHTYDFSGKVVKDFWPKRPAWTIDVVGPSVEENIEPNEVFPEAHTHGLENFNHAEIQIRLIGFRSSGFLLNLIAGWIAGGHGKLEDGDVIIVPPLEIKVRKEKYLGHGNNQNIFRLTWNKDP